MDQVFNEDGYGGDINAFIEDMRGLKDRELDAVLWGSGPVGYGKSTVMRQVLKAVDPAGFTIDRIHFTQEDYMDGIATTPQGGALLWDEARLQRRQAMGGARSELLDVMQDCRGLLQIHGWCFPYEAWMDDALEEQRITARLDVFKRGMFNLQVPERGKSRGKTWHNWITIDTFRFGPNRGLEERQYRAKKDAHMRGRFRPRSRRKTSALGLDTTQALAVVDDLRKDLLEDGVEF